MFVADWILFAIQWGGALTGLFAFVHALLQRSDAYSAADRKTKPIWMLITGGSTAVLTIFQFYGGGMILWLPALVAVLVYLVDVRPKLIEVQRGGRNW